MSSITLSGDTSGSIQLTVPAVAGSNTVTIAAQTGTLNAAGPAFSAYQSSSQTLPTTTNTKIQFQTKEFDTANCFDNATNYRFTPTVAGYYQVSGGLQVLSSNTNIAIYVYKNGSQYKQFVNSSTNYVAAYGSGLVYLNGSTDYIELYGSIGIGQGLNASSVLTYFQACLVRGA